MQRRQPQILKHVLQSSIPTRSAPTGLVNSVVLAPLPLVTSTFQDASPSQCQHTLLFIITELNITLSEAAVAGFCLNQYVAHYYIATPGPWLSLKINIERPVLLRANDMACR